MATTYVRRFDLKSSLSDSEVTAFWKEILTEFLPACRNITGVQAARIYSGAGALRADLRIMLELDNAGVYETAIRQQNLHAMLVRFYRGIDLKTSTQTFLREITPELVQALSP